MSRLGTFATVAGGAAVVAAAAAAGVIAERRAVARQHRESLDVPFGSLHGERRMVRADDGLELYVEVDEVDAERAAGGPTVIFVHGYALNLDSWHFQRAALRGRYRLVFYDQRSHGRSARSRAEHCNLDQLGRDLEAVIDAVSDDGPVVLVGHSMGGMTIMALAEQRPDWFGSRVVGVGLLCTAASDLNQATLGLPGLPGRLLHRLSPSLMATLARAPRLVERGRRAGSDIGFVVTRKLAFGGPVPEEYVDFTDEMLAATPFEVVADFFPGFETHDRLEALTALSWAPTLVVGGTEDAITPIDHARRMIRLLPSAEVLELDGAGHMAQLERSEEVNGALERLLDKAIGHE
ncbi:MAG: alpha/beta fold hydrolase [Nocardioidaceae bacterium]